MHLVRRRDKVVCKLPSFGSKDKRKATSFRETENVVRETASLGRPSYWFLNSLVILKYHIPTFPVHSGTKAHVVTFFEVFDLGIG